MLIEQRTHKGAAAHMNKFLYLLICSASLLLSTYTSTVRALKILIYVNHFPRPSETFVINQVIGLIEQGHDVSILTTAAHSDASLPKSIKKAFDKLLIRYNLENKIFRQKLPAGKKNFDILLCQFGTLAPSLMQLKKQSGLRGKLVTMIRGKDITQKASENKQAYAQLFKTGDFFVPVCSLFKQKLIKLGCTPAKIQVIHSGIDCTKFSFRPKTPEPNKPVKLITVSRLVEKKGTEYAIKAAYNLLQKHVNLEYSIVGDGPLRQQLQQLINSLGIQEKVKLLGWRSHDEVIQLLSSSHIFILPSLTAYNGDSEGIPNALKEAMAIGLPVISTHHSGIPELIKDGITGFLVPERNSTALEDKLAYLLHNTQTWHTLSTHARSFVEQKFSIRKTNQQLHILLTTLAHQNRAHYSEDLLW